jgi:curved DNA-binding protein CbpA
MMPNDGELWEEAMARMARQRDGPSGDLPSKGREYYAALGVTEKATQTEIKQAYRRASMHLHPDRNPSPNAQQEFEDLTKAYKVLSDPTSRKKYDAGGEEALKGNGGGGDVDRRDTLRSLFGGDALRDLAGEVRATRFFRRIIDKIQYSVEEVAIINARGADRAAETLLTYLTEHPGVAPEEPEKNRAAKTAYDKEMRAWEQAVKRKTNAFINTGVAKEILNVLGEEYHKVLDEDDLSSAQRVIKGVVGTPERLARKVNPWVYVFRKGSKAGKDPSIVMETVWGMSVVELRDTARYAAQKVALDVSATPEELARRKAALRDLARVFVKTGKVWDGVSDKVMRSISNSAAEDMRRRSRERDQR